MNTLVMAALVLLPLGCGSKTALGVETAEGPVDASPPPDTEPPLDTMPPPRPDCFEMLDPGVVRGSLEDIDARPAYDAEGNLYAPRLVDDETWTLVSYDPCLAMRWSVDIGEFDGRARRIRTTVDDTGHVWLKGRFDVVRATTDGVLAPAMLEVEGNVWTWIGIPSGGPVYGSTNGTDMPKYLYRTRAGGGADRVQLEEVSSYVWADECLVADRGALCWNVAYDLDDLSLRYYRDPPTLLDGTLRNITQPAFDGERLWTLRFGISTYDVVAISPRTGETLVRAPVARTTAGQSDAIMSPVVIGAAGEIVVYFTGRRASGPDGQLRAFSPEDGSELWSYSAPRTGRANVFSVDSSIAIGDANVAYLAVGELVHAVVVSNGTGRWTAGGVGDVNDPDIQISPLGDVAVLNTDNTLNVLATESRAIARSPWPVAGGDPSGTYAR